MIDEWIRAQIGFGETNREIAREGSRKFGVRITTSCVAFWRSKMR
jgi:hypothetical protein